MTISDLLPLVGLNPFRIVDSDLGEIFNNVNDNVGRWNDEYNIMEHIDHGLLDRGVSRIYSNEFGIISFLLESSAADVGNDIDTRFIVNAHKYMFHMLNTSGSIDHSDRIKSEFLNSIDKLEKDGKKVVKIVGSLLYCDKSDLT